MVSIIVVIILHLTLKVVIPSQLSFNGCLRLILGLLSWKEWQICVNLCFSFDKFRFRTSHLTIVQAWNVTIIHHWITNIQINWFILVYSHLVHCIVNILGITNLFVSSVILATKWIWNRLIPRREISLCTFSLITTDPFSLHARCAAVVNSLVRRLIYSSELRSWQTCTLFVFISHLRTIHPLLFILNRVWTCVHHTHCGFTIAFWYVIILKINVVNIAHVSLLLNL